MDILKSYDKTVNNFFPIAKQLHVTIKSLF